jgi:hypothetical protein
MKAPLSTVFLSFFGEKPVASTFGGWFLIRLFFTRDLAQHEEV